MVSHSLSDSVHNPQQVLNCDLHGDCSAALVLHILPLLIQLGMHYGARCITAGELEMWPFACAHPAQNLWANLVKHSSDLHGASVSFGLKGAGFALISVPAWGNVLQVSCEMGNSQGLREMQLMLQVSHGNLEFSCTPLVNTLMLCRALGAGRAWKRPVHVPFLLADVPLIKPGCVRAGIKGLKGLAGSIQGLCKGLDALKTRAFAFIRGQY